MTRLPHTSAVPDPALLFAPPTSSSSSTMSSTSTPTNTAGPTPTPLPNGTQNDAQPEQIPIHRHDPDEKEPWKPAQKLRLNILDLNHPGASRFLAAVHASSVFADSVATVLRILYKENPTSVPGTRSVTLYLEDMPGVAYTTGSDLDNDHKEIRKCHHHVA